MNRELIVLCGAVTGILVIFLWFLGDFTITGFIGLENAYNDFGKKRVANLSPNHAYGLEGRVRIVDEKTIRLENFSYDSPVPNVEIVLKKGNRKVHTLLNLDGVKYSHATIEFYVPENVDLFEIDSVEVYCETGGLQLSSACFD